MNDTDPKAAAVQIDLLRKAGVTRRASIALRLSDDVVGRSRRALAERMPGATELDVKLRWVELWYGAELAARLRGHLAGPAGEHAAESAAAAAPGAEPAEPIAEPAGG